mmetsp:Transcript_24702/g.69333  ORF Transcript_24702/g.69333 Transcript_24702/m.69333 type:complete len:248 (-) Transcript_24702:696-1439(-)
MFLRRPAHFHDRRCQEDTRAFVPRHPHRHCARPDGQERSRAERGRIRRGESRNLAGNDRHRERCGHPYGEHHHHPEQSSVRYVHSVPAARACRSFRPAGVRLLSVPGRDGDGASSHASSGHRRIERARFWIRCRQSRFGNPWSRKPAGNGAERNGRARWIRPVHAHAEEVHPPAAWFGLAASPAHEHHAARPARKHGNHRKEQEGRYCARKCLQHPQEVHPGRERTRQAGNFRSFGGKHCRLGGTHE